MGILDALEADNLAKGFASEKPAIPTTLANPTVRQDGTVHDRAKAYVATMPPAISGQRGHDQTYTVAQALVVGFELADSEALSIMRSWNETCQPPWDDRDLIRKVDEARTKSKLPPGYLRDAPLPTNRAGPLTKTHEKAPGKGNSRGSKQNITKSEDSTDEASEQGEPRRKQSEILADLALAQAVLTHYDDRTYATFQWRSRRETTPIASQTFSRWLTSLWVGVPSQTAVREAVGYLDSLAARSEQREVHKRIAHQGGKVYLDLANEAGDIVEMSPLGWRIIQDAPVLFVRTGSMLALPIPNKLKPLAGAGILSRFRALLNVKREHENPILDPGFIIALGWLLGAMQPDRPCPMLVLTGEQGTAKSTMTRLLRQVIDPNRSDLRKPFEKEDDLAVACANSRVIAIDNASRLTGDMSDLMCGVITGSGLSKRQLYTDSDEHLIEFRNPMLINGVVNPVSRPDLLERSFVVELEVIRDRRTESEVFEAFETIWPDLLGLLCQAVACALAYFGKMPASYRPVLRMADFDHWVTAGEPALGLPRMPGVSWGIIREICSKQQESAAIAALDDNDVGRIIVDLADGDGWSGTMSELLSKIRDRASHSKTLPGSPAHLSRMVKRLASNLRKAGVVIEESRISAKRGVTIRSSKGGAG